MMIHPEFTITPSPRSPPTGSSVIQSVADQLPPPIPPVKSTAPHSPAIVVVVVVVHIVSVRSI